jgi:hypothetical protein
MGMTVLEALEIVGDGHSVASVEVAKEVCEVFHVSFSEDLIISWQSQQQAFECYGFFPFEDGPGEGVECLSLSYHVAKSLGLGAPGSAFSGRGYQARANAQAIVSAYVESGGER